jgi:hypothetical protein
MNWLRVGGWVPPRLRGFNFLEEYGFAESTELNESYRVTCLGPSPRTTIKILLRLVRRTSLLNGKREPAAIQVLMTI